MHACHLSYVRSINRRSKVQTSQQKHEILSPLQHTHKKLKQKGLGAWLKQHNTCKYEARSSTSTTKKSRDFFKRPHIFGPLPYSEIQGHTNQETRDWDREARARWETARRVTEKPKGWIPALQRASKSFPATDIPLGHNHYPSPGPEERLWLSGSWKDFQAAHLSVRGRRGSLPINQAPFTHWVLG
jgi:hypothetical protein